MKPIKNIFCLIFLLVPCLISVVNAARLHVAVASNFLSTIEQLVEPFKLHSGHELLISSGSTGMLYAQIIQGAPFDVMMAADTATPQKLTAAGLANQPFTYARGQLMLLANQSTEDSCLSILASANLQFLAIANPQVAPYGLAAKQFLQSIQWWDSHQSQLVMGENVAQAMQMTVSENATAGLVASSILMHHELLPNQCIWQPPANSYTPIDQAMVLLARSKQQVIYDEFKDFLLSKQAIAIIQSNGYKVASNNSKGLTK